MGYNEFISLKRLFYPNRALPGSADACVYAREERWPTSTQECGWANWANQVKNQINVVSGAPLALIAMQIHELDDLSFRVHARKKKAQPAEIRDIGRHRLQLSRKIRKHMQRETGGIDAGEEKVLLWWSKSSIRDTSRLYKQEMEAFRKLHAYLTHLCPLVWSLCSHTTFLKSSNHWVIRIRGGSLPNGLWTLKWLFSL